MDLKSGQSRVLTEAKDLRTESLALSPDERTLYYFDGGALEAMNLANQRPRELYRLPEGSELVKGFTVSADGLNAAWVERRAGKSRIQLMAFRTAAAQTVFSSADEISDPLPCPKRAALLYRAGETLWQINFDGAQNRKLRTAPGSLGQALWSSDGRSIFYLNLGTEAMRQSTLREFVPDTNEDRLLSKTSQFVTFNRNGDSSVFVGASGSKASPYVLLLVRSVQRELALCEHRASDARLTAPVFSPNSQRVFFQSDREGKMAIYYMAVDRLVGETEAEPQSSN
jgi:oligogalacturonide lyase